MNCRGSLQNLTLLAGLFLFAVSLHRSARLHAQPPGPADHDRTEQAAASEPELYLGNHSARPAVGDSEKRPVESSLPANDRARLEAIMAGPDFPGIFGGPAEDPGRLVDGKSETAVMTIEDVEAIGTEESFPAAAQCVILGTVRDSEAFLSANRKYVYSDYHVVVEKTLKQDPLNPRRDGDSILMYRDGGTLRFPSGHVTDFYVRGSDFPEVGGRYLLFLWRRDGIAARYSIDIAYRLENGTVYALDGRKVYSQHDGADEDSFLAEVRRALQRSSVAPSVP